VVVDVDSRRPKYLQNISKPIDYAKRFVTLQPIVYGSHDIDLVDGQIVKSLNVVDTEVVWEEAYQI
jgi:hypothetical protein